MTEEPKRKAEGDLSLKELILHFQSIIHFLLSKWGWITLFVIIGLLAGLSYAFLKDPMYSGTISFVTDTDVSNPSALSSYAGVAAQFGLNFGNNADNGLFSGDNIYDLMKTKRMLESTLLTPVVIDGKKMLLVDRYIKIKKLKNKWKKYIRSKNIPFDTDTSKFTIYNNAIIASICKAITTDNLQFSNQSENSGSSIMSVTFTFKDEQFCSLFLTNLINNVAQFYVDTKTRTARRILNVMYRQLDSVRKQLYGGMAQVAAFQDKNLNLVKEAPMVQQQKSSLKNQINSAIYQQLVSAVETAKMNLQKATPLFEIIDKPILPLEKKQPGKLICGIAGAFVALFLSICWLLIKRFYQRIMTE